MPHIGPDVTLNNPAYIHDTAQLHGKVTLSEGVSVWPYVVTRAEMHEIVIGARSKELREKPKTSAFRETHSISVTYRPLNDYPLVQV